MNKEPALSNSMPQEAKRLYLKPLAPYENQLLNALAFFHAKRRPTVQAHHCLSTYLRNSEREIMAEIRYYANLVGITEFEMLQMVDDEPDKAESLIQQVLNAKHQSSSLNTDDDETDTEDWAE